MAHIVRMQRVIETKLIAEWVKTVGGISKAAGLIQTKLECSKSKAEKLAGNRYPSVPSPSEQKLLAALLKQKRDRIFPLAGGQRQAS